MCIKKILLWDGSDRCQKEYQNDTFSGFCPSVWDNFLCWPPTPPGNKSIIQCPQLNWNDVGKLAFRYCLENGSWTGGDQQNPDAEWTTNNSCLNPYVQEFMKNIHGSQTKPGIYEANRTLEIIGLTFSIFSLLMSQIFFHGFRNLQNNRTMIHKNLFVAVSIQVIVQLIQHFDKIYTSDVYILETMKYACETAYVLMEYVQTAIFLWMFIEVLHLHKLITVTAFQEFLTIKIYYILGWGSPILPIIIWGGLTYHSSYNFVCFAGYNLSGFSWTLVPRQFVFGLNLLFLANIIRILGTKLSDSNSAQTIQVRKAVKAGVVLVPLMGIANLVQSTYWPLEMNIIQLGNLSYLVTTLISFQGFFCSLIYCFLNRQVKQSLKRFFKDWKARITTTRQNPNASPDAFFVVPNPTPFGAMVDSPDRIRRNQRSRSEELRKHKQQRTFGGSVGKRKVKVVGEGAGVDPFFEHWSDVELSAHNNVDIEQIEIPLQYFAQGPNTVHSNIDTAYSKLATSSRTAQSTSMDARISHVDLNSPGSSSNKACQRGQRGQAQGQVRSILSKIDISRPQLPHNADQQIME